SLDVSHFDTGSVTDMYGMFSNCSNLTSLDVSHFDTGSVTSMWYMFFDCSSLIDLDVSHFDTGSVTTMYEMFFGCSSLTSLDVSHFDTSSVTTMNDMFGDCSSLTSLDLSSFDMNSTTGATGADIFINNTNSLTAIYSPRNLNKEVRLPYNYNNNPWYYYTIKEGDEEPEVVYVSSFPQDSESSILLVRGSSPADPPARKESITVKKTKTAYYCGESIETDDLTVQYYGMDGTIRKVTDYTTDAESIDMSTTGNKTLTVSYTSAGTGEALTAAVTLTVTYSIENALTVTLPEETYVYNRTVHKPVPVVTYTANGTEKVLTEETDYTVSYRNNKNAYQSADADEDPNAPAVIIKGCGEYGGTVIKTFAIRKADAPKEAEMTQEIYDYETEKQSRKLSLSDSFAKYGDKTGFILGTPIEDDTISGSVLSGEHSVSKGGMLTYSTNAGSEGDFVTIPVTVSFANYEDSTLNVKIKFVKKETTEKVSISGIEMKDSIYQKHPVSSTGTAKVTTTDGTDVTDAVSLVYTYSGTQADGSAYAATTTAPTNAGSYKLTISVAQNDKNYTGSTVYSFSIAKAPLTITARDMGLKIGASLPNATDYQYDTAGLLEGDNLITEPTFACNIADTAEEGTYDITVSGADAGMNYEITYKNGILTVSEKGESTKYYTVTFRLSGYGSNITNTGVKEGSTLEKPQDPQADGYTFTGWYKDQSCTVLWDFDKDTVQSDTTLYAGWAKNGTTGGDDEDDSPYEDSERTDLASASVNGTIATIKAKVYDQNAYEPAVKVTVTETVNGGKKKITLTEGTDYRVLYKDNVNAGEGKVIVKGNGIYKGEIEKTFTINPKPVKKLKVLTSGIVGTATMQAASGAVYVYDGTKRLVENVDYEISDVQPVKNKKDVVQVTVKGKSNYGGEVTTKITVYESGTDLSKLIIPDNVTLVPESPAKAAQEAYAYTGKAVKPAVTVKIGDMTLTNKDYKVQYQNNKDAGTAYVVVTGKGTYKGKAVIPFTIKAETVASPNNFAIKAIKDMTYNGKLQKPAVKVTIQKNGKTKNLSKKDYTVAYKSNLHAGNATVTVTGKGNYAGLSATTTFKINPQQIKKASLKGTQGNLVLTYSKRTLKEGTDYEKPEYGTVNKNKVPVTITGKGDFTGTMTKTVKIQ
ncbi:MAG: BspA family leucine-rich repeat surface protein, partial [Lachnospiraceae bacterium]|nr:BspA family leucine-rich repeat surface protein [Lachnospiraceae bacterium]